MSLYELVRGYASLSIIGLCKNAGKTTALNSLLRASPPEGLAVTSIGRDGEGEDVATGTKKPPIFIREGTLLATAKNLLSVCDITKEILDVPGMETPLGEIVVLRAHSDGFVQLAGPSTVSQLARLSERFRALGAQKIWIDGAAGRRSLSARRLAEATVLCTGASCGGSLAEVVAETAYVSELLQLSEAEAADIALDGALSEGYGKDLLQKGTRDAALLVQDASKILLSRATYEKLGLRGNRITVRESVRLAAVAANPWSAYGAHFDREEFLAALRERISVPVVDVEAGLSHDQEISG